MIYGLSDFLNLKESLFNKPAPSRALDSGFGQGGTVGTGGNAPRTPRKPSVSALGAETARRHEAHTGAISRVLRRFALQRCRKGLATTLQHLSLPMLSAARRQFVIKNFQKFSQGRNEAAKASRART